MPVGGDAPVIRHETRASGGSHGLEKGGAVDEGTRNLHDERATRVWDLEGGFAKIEKGDGERLDGACGYSIEIPPTPKHLVKFHERLLSELTSQKCWHSHQASISESQDRRRWTALRPLMCH